MGSGNIGATNVFRTLGKTAGIVVLVADGLKGWFAVDQVPFLVHKLASPAGAWDLATQEYLKIIAGIVVILGHNYTCWLKFKGGKGIATTAGVLAALVPWTFVIGLSTWIVVLLLTRYVSVASTAAGHVARRVQSPAYHRDRSDVRAGNLQT
jgi:glycerol-3-phosphate acyltransferase PlsY